MKTGIVKFFNSEKKFGFISVKNQKDLFFHITEWQEKDEPRQGDEVTFEIKPGKKGDMATNVERT